MKCSYLVDSNYRNYLDYLNNNNNNNSNTNINGNTQANLTVEIHKIKQEKGLVKINKRKNTEQQESKTKKKRKNTRSIKTTDANELRIKPNESNISNDCELIKETISKTNFVRTTNREDCVLQGDQWLESHHIFLALCLIEEKFRYTFQPNGLFDPGEFVYYRN